MSAFGDNLKALRFKKSMTQEELAKALEISKSAVSMYECGKREPNFETLENIADLFNVDLVSLIGRTPSAELFDGTTRQTTDDDIKFALFDGDKDITDAQYEEVKRFARWVKERDKNDGR